MNKVILLLLLSLAIYSSGAQAETSTVPQYVLDQAPFLGGNNVISLSWYTGNISDGQNFEKNLLENFALHLDRLGIPEDIVPEIIKDVSAITTETDITEKNFDPGKDKLIAEISYNRLRLKELGDDVQVLTPPWQDAKEIVLSSPEALSLTKECGNTNGIKAIEVVPAKDMSNLVTVDGISEQILDELNNDHSLVVQNAIAGPEVRNAAVLVNNNLNANKSSGLRYIVVGNNQDSVNCILSKIADASGVSGSGSSPSVLSDPVSPIPPVPELSPIILVSAGLLGLLLLSKKYKKN